ncbi:nuclear transport factor 2 family protein [Sphingobacterium sp. WOUb80]|uniref:nuclear transport factor 2 family protein n=1 Tax=Sphingobacterium sp. WOUb80 TaxID=3234028 RepID=UPI003CE8E72F
MEKRNKCILIGYGFLLGVFGFGCSSGAKPPLIDKDTSVEVVDVKETNKKVVLDFYQQMFGDKDTAAVDKYILPSYIQHNPDVPDGAEAFKSAAVKWFKGSPKIKIDAQHIAAEGDLVFLHVRDKNANGTVTSTIDIFRLEGGKIAEHWDVRQQVPVHAANKHPMF